METKKKKRKWLKRLLIFIIVIVVIVVGVGLLFPGLLWSKDLGIDYSESDLKSAESKLELLQGGQVIEFTSEELTALFNSSSVTDAFKNTQVKIANGRLELTGKANLNNLLNSMNMSRETLNSQIPGASMLPNFINLNVITYSMEDKASNIGVESLSAQGINIGSSYSSKLSDLMGNVIEEAVGTKIDYYQVRNSKLVVTPSK